MLSILSLFLTQEEISNSIYVQTIRFTNVTIKKKQNVILNKTNHYLQLNEYYKRKCLSEILT